VKPTGCRKHQFGAPKPSFQTEALAHRPPNTAESSPQKVSQIWNAGTYFKGKLFALRGVRAGDGENFSCVEQKSDLLVINVNGKITSPVATSIATCSVAYCCECCKKRGNLEEKNGRRKPQARFDRGWS
jgi:hypothetical protein